tara:strand:+ start:113 stop:649 length:537 start_codon:yes stop_codon:yes gene_type:complete
MLLGVIFMTLIIGSIQYASADHSLGGNGIFMDENNVNLATTKDSKFLIHLQIIVRDGQGQLVSVTEATHGFYIPHRVTDQVFDEFLSEKEIVNIDKIRYERGQLVQTSPVQDYPFKKTFEDMQSYWGIEYCLSTANWDEKHGDERGITCIPVFQTTTPHVSLGEDDVFTQHWTILREI